jgi:tripartite-type tricarboxylate transporter receptor subunit TctC
MSEILGVSMVIDNRGGGGGTLGVDAAARADADGYTLLHATNSELHGGSGRAGHPAL